MSLAKSFLVVIMSLSGIALLATQKYNSQVLEAHDSAEPACRVLKSNITKEETKELRNETYKQAFKLSFDKRWAEARDASACAGWLDHGSKNWAFEAKNLIYR